MCHPGVGTKLFFEAVNSNTSYIMLLGSGCSEVAKTVSLAANLWNIVQVSYAASSPSLSNRETYASFYRTNVADSLYNYARLAIIKHYGWRRVATLYENREAYSTAVNLFTELLATNGINLTTSESFTVEPGEQIANLKEKGAWIIFGNFQETMARKVFCEAYKQNLYGKNYAWFLIGTYSARWWEKPDNSTSCTPAQIYAALDGYISTSALPMSLYPGDPTVSGYTASQLADAFAMRAESAGLSGDVTTSASDAYDAAWSIALTLHEAASTGPANDTDELHEFSYTNSELKDAFMNSLYNLRFEGFSGSVSFTDTGDREGLIEIRQVREESERVVGLYAFQQDDLAGSELNITGLQWAGDGPPKDQTTEEIVFATIPRLYLYVFGALCVAGIVFVVCCFTVTVLYWDRSAFSRASTPFLVIGQIGCVGMYISIFLMGVGSDVIGADNQVIICTVRAWTMTLSFCLAYGALFAKIYRAHKLLVMKANLWKPGTHLPSMIRSLMSLVIVCLVVLIVWTVGFPIQREVLTAWNEYNEDENTRYFYKVEYCLRGMGVYFAGALMGFLGLALLLGAFLSYETRSMTIITLNDTFVTGIASYCSVTFSVVSAPLAFIMSNNPPVCFPTVAALTWLGVSLVLIIVYTPKFHALRDSWGQKRSSQMRSIQEIYDEEVDEETKLRHKIDEVDRDIEEFKAEIQRRKAFGGQSLSRGVGLWCFGSYLQLNFGHRKIKVPSVHTQMRKPTAGEGTGGLGEYDNHAMDASDWDLTARQRGRVDSTSPRRRPRREGGAEDEQEDEKDEDANGTAADGRGPIAINFTSNLTKL
ncbi:gamma-aminobutyric acid type B receptor subunit 1-like [Diadema antillarum]|uniref:gamma-aminobutyric acid type B receptor subunit 1-like n=1 Tax=Diadema antillarum TaxID=105358 RepID=UPI003A8872D9